jgi:hypothetical protein
MEFLVRRDSGKEWEFQYQIHCCFYVVLKCFSMFLQFYLLGLLLCPKKCQVISDMINLFKF